MNTSQGYGMTETGVTHVNKDDEFRYKSVGKALNLIETKVSQLTISDFNKIRNRFNQVPHLTQDTIKRK